MRQFVPVAGTDAGGSVAGGSVVAGFDVDVELVLVGPTLVGLDATVVDAGFGTELLAAGADVVVEAVFVFEPLHATAVNDNAAEAASASAA